MKNNKRLGIFMDHARATLIEDSGEIIGQNNIVGQLTPKEKGIDHKENESQTLSKEQRLLSGFYKGLESAIIGYQEVLLFGPTHAKDELYNLLKENHLFDDIKIETRNSDKISEVEMQSFVKDYFNDAGTKND